MESVHEGHLHWMTLKPKRKSDHVEVVYKTFDLQELEELGRIKYQARQMQFYHLKDLIDQITAQQKQDAILKKHLKQVQSLYLSQLA